MDDLRKQHPDYIAFKKLMYGERRLNEDGIMAIEHSPYHSLNNLRELLKSKTFKDFAALYPQDDHSGTPVNQDRTASRRRG